MNTIETLQKYMKGHWAVKKTRRTTCTYKRGFVPVTEKRLWVWFSGSETPTLIKEDWLTGSDRDDFKIMFDNEMRRA